MGQIENKYQDGRFKSHHVSKNIKRKWFLGGEANDVCRPNLACSMFLHGSKLRKICTLQSVVRKEEKKGV